MLVHGISFCVLRTALPPIRTVVSSVLRFKTCYTLNVHNLKCTQRVYRTQRKGDPCMGEFEVSNRNEILTRKTQDNPFAYLEKLPFRIGSDAWKQRLKEARKNKEKAKAINCFSASKYEILGSRLTVRIFNEKTQHWQEEIAVKSVRFVALLCLSELFKEPLGWPCAVPNVMRSTPL